jgi:transposase
MKILGCDLHAKQQTIAMVDTETGEITEKTLSHEGNEVREFYAALEGPVVVGIEATGAMRWFLEPLEELGIVCRVIRRRFVQPRPGNRSMIGGMPG